MQLSSEPLISDAKIQERILALAADISRDYQGQELVIVPVLNGAIHFASDLMRALTIPSTIEFIRAKSYNGTQPSGLVEFPVTPVHSLEGRHILVVEDILDTGKTTEAVLGWLRAENPASLRLATLLNKPENRAVYVNANYVGFVISDCFVVGYGLDYNEQYRNLNSVYILHSG